MTNGHEGNGRASATPGSPGVVDDRATSEVVASLVANSQALVRKELELAKLETRRIVREKAVAAGTAAGGALLGLFILAFVGVTGAKALELVLAEWLAWLIVTVVYAVVAGVLFLVAMRYAKRTAMPERTRGDVEQTVEWAKGQVQR